MTAALGAALALVVTDCDSNRSVDSTPDAATQDPGEPGSPWPQLPRTPAEAEALVEARTLRSRGRERAEPTVEEVLGWIPREGATGLVAGLDSVIAHLSRRLDAAGRDGRDAYVLVGTFHDSAGQVELYRRLVGPGGLEGLTDAAVEQLHAGGRWQGVAPEDQRGDDEDLAAYLSTGARAAWRRLELGQQRRDYSAWRYGYVPGVMDVVAAARASGAHLVGCDMPAPTQRLARGVGERTLDRLRELHCALALGDGRAPRGPRRVAMLWGAEHASPAGFPRFVPERALVLSVRLIGHRANPLHLEGRLEPSLVVNDAALVPVPGGGADELALFLPCPRLGGDVERSRIAEPGALERAVEVEVTSDQAATFSIGGRDVAVGEAPVRIEVPRGDGSFVLRAGSRVVIGRLELEAARRVEVSFSPGSRHTRLVYFTADDAP